MPVIPLANKALELTGRRRSGRGGFQRPARRRQGKVSAIGSAAAGRRTAVVHLAAGSSMLIR